MTAIRHGSGFLEPISEVPKLKFKKVKEYLFEHSESGNHHVIVSDTEFEVAEKDDDLFVRLFKPAKIVHQGAARHKTLTIPIGIYRRFRAKEYDFLGQVVRPVFD